LHPFPTPLTVREALLKYCDLTSLISKKSLKKLGDFASNCDEKQKLDFLASLKGKDEFKRTIQEPMLTIVDILYKFPSVKVPIGVLVQILDRMQPRTYQVASSSKVNPKRLEIAVEVLRQRTSEGKTRTGLCSGYFENMHVTALFKKVRGFFKEPAFKLPWPPSPVFMVSQGCGVAVCRAFIQELQILLKEGVTYPEVYLYFGSKSKAKEFIYKQDLEKALIPVEEEPEPYEHRPAKWGEGPYVLSKLFTAFSRDQTHKIYVQDILFAQHERLWEALSDRNACVFLSGPGVMVKSVDELLQNIASEHLGEDSQELFRTLKDEKRYCIEYWDNAK